MKNDINVAEIDLLSMERDIADIAPLFNEISDREKLGTPSPDIISAIYSEASSYTLRRRFEHKLRRVLRVAAAAAVVILVMAGGMRFNSVQEHNRREEVLNQLAIVSSEDGAIQQDSLGTSNAALAEMLMQMQGLDEETYFAVN